VFHPRAWEQLGEDISNHVTGRDVGNGDEATLDDLANEVVLYIYMLHPGVVLIILGD